MSYVRNLQSIEAQIARDKKLLSSYRHKKRKANNQAATAQETEKLKEGISSLEQVAAWLRYKDAAR